MLKSSAPQSRQPSSRAIHPETMLCLGMALHSLLGALHSRFEYLVNVNVRCHAVSSGFVRGQFEIPYVIMVSRPSLRVATGTQLVLARGNDLVLHTTCCGPVSTALVPGGDDRGGAVIRVFYPIVGRVGTMRKGGGRAGHRKRIVAVGIDRHSDVSPSSPRRGGQSIQPPPSTRSPS